MPNIVPQIIFNNFLTLVDCTPWHTGLTSAVCLLNTDMLKSQTLENELCLAHPLSLFHSVSFLEYEYLCDIPKTASHYPQFCYTAGY